MRKQQVSKEEVNEFAKFLADRLMDENSTDPNIIGLRKSMPKEKMQEMIEWRKNLGE